MDLDMKDRDLKQNKKIENLFNIIRPIGIPRTTYNKVGMVNCLRPVTGCYPDETFLVGRSNARSWHGYLLAV